MGFLDFRWLDTIWGRSLSPVSPPIYYRSGGVHLNLFKSLEYSPILGCKSCTICPFETYPPNKLFIITNSFYFLHSGLCSPKKSLDIMDRSDNLYILRISIPYGGILRIWTNWTGIPLYDKSSISGISYFGQEYKTL